MKLSIAFLPIYFAWREVVTVGRQPVAKRPSREEGDHCKKMILRLVTESGHLIVVLVQAGLAALFSRPLDLALVVYAGAAVVFCFVVR